MMKKEELLKTVRVVKDFPKPGIQFYDITTLLQHGEAFKTLVTEMKNMVEGRDVDCIVAIDARGFIVGAAVAALLGVGFVPVRKPGKLPYETVTHEYELEYGVDALSIHTDGVRKGQRIAILDDLLATGGTAYTAIQLVERLGGKVDCLVCAIDLINLGHLPNRQALANYDVMSVLQAQG